MSTKKLPFAPYKTLVLGILHHLLVDAVDIVKKSGFITNIPERTFVRIAICYYLLKDFKYIETDNVILSLNTDQLDYFFDSIKVAYYQIYDLPSNSLKDLILDFSF